MQQLALNKTELGWFNWHSGDKSCIQEYFLIVKWNEFPVLLSGYFFFLKAMTTQLTIAQL